LLQYFAVLLQILTGFLLFSGVLMRGWRFLCSKSQTGSRDMAPSGFPSVPAGASSHTPLTRRQAAG